MEKYLVSLTVPSLGLMSDPPNYIKTYVVEAKNLDSLSEYIDNKLMRNFSLEFNSILANVRILFVAKIK